LAAELAKLAEVVAGRLTANGEMLRAAFEVDADQPRGHSSGWTFLPRKGWPLAPKRLDYLQVTRRDGVGYAPWQCKGLNSAWSDPSGDEFCRIFEKKGGEGEKYTTNDLPLWLLIVSDVERDPQSLVYPANDDDVRKVREAVNASGFDFEQGCFEQVWLLSATTGNSLPLFCRAGA